jgi:hypothetical protein
VAFMERRMRLLLKTIGGKKRAILVRVFEFIILSN